MILVKEAKGIVHKHGGVWYRAGSHGMLQDVCDQREHHVKQSVKEQEFWLVCKRRGEVKGTVAWKKWLSGLGMQVVWSGTLWCVGGAGLMASVHARSWFSAAGVVWMRGSHDAAAEKERRVHTSQVQW